MVPTSLFEIKPRRSSGDSGSYTNSQRKIPREVLGQTERNTRKERSRQERQKERERARYIRTGEAERKVKEEGEARKRRKSLYGRRHAVGYTGFALLPLPGVLHQRKHTFTNTLHTT